MRNLVCVALLALTALLPLRNADAASANLTLTVTSTGVTTPPQAAAQGFTTLAFNGDMTQGFDVSCANPATGNHQWYLGGSGTMSASCVNLTYPHIDETDGSTVLDIHQGPSDPILANFDRTGISTTDDRGAHNTNFPINGYYECTVRMDAYSVSHMPLWHNCWMVDVRVAQAGFGITPMEWDLTEFHGGYDQAMQIGASINWQCGGPGSCPGSAGYFFVGNLANVVPGYSTSKFAKYGMLINQTDANTVHVASYVNDVKVAEGTVPINFDQIKTQRNYILIDLVTGCQWDEGGKYCLNQPITNVFADGSGNTHIETPNATMNTQWLINIQGVTGITSPINGNFGFIQDNWAGGAGGNFGCVDGMGGPAPCTLKLLTASPQVGGQPIHLTGSYTGGGTVNTWTDPGMHVYVKSYRVWSCANWQTSQCSPFNPN